MDASGKKAAGAFDSRFSCYQNASIAIAQDTWLKLEWASKWYDPLSELDIVTDHQFTAAMAGYYAFKASFNVTPMADNTSIQLRFKVNGQTENKGGGAATAFASHAEGWTYVQASIEVYLTAGQIVFVEGYQSDAGIKTYAARIMHWSGHRFA